MNYYIQIILGIYIKYFVFFIIEYNKNDKLTNLFIHIIISIIINIISHILCKWIDKLMEK